MLAYLYKNKRLSALLLFGAVQVVVFVILFITILSQAAKSDSQHNDHAAVVRTAAMSRQIQDHEAMLSHLAGLADAIKHQMDQHLSQQEFSKIINQKAVQHQISISRESYTFLQSQTSAGKFGLKLEVDGSYADIRHFLQDIQHAPVLLVYNDVNMTGKQGIIHAKVGAGVFGVNDGQ